MSARVADPVAKLVPDTPPTSLAPLGLLPARRAQARRRALRSRRAGTSPVDPANLRSSDMGASFGWRANRNAKVVRRSAHREGGRPSAAQIIPHGPPTFPRTSIGKSNSPAVLITPYPASAAVVKRVARLPPADAQTPTARATTRTLYGMKSQTMSVLVGAPAGINSLTIWSPYLWYSGYRRAGITSMPREKANQRGNRRVRR